MNRIFTNKYINDKAAPINPLHRPAKQFRVETERALRDMAFVLHLTRKVKDQIMDERKETAGV